MNNSNRNVILLSASILGGVGLFFLGTQVGEWTEKKRFEFIKGYAPIEADEYLNAGNIDKAMRPLFLAKAFEAREGMADEQLARAYSAKGMPCLAEGYLESSLKYMEKNGLTMRPSYSNVKDALAKAERECLDARKKGVK